MKKGDIVSFFHLSPVGNTVSVRVGRTANNDQNQVNKDTDRAQAAREHPKKSREDLSLVKTMDAQRTKEDAKQKVYKSGFFRHDKASLSFPRRHPGINNAVTAFYHVFIHLSIVLR